MKVLIYSLLAAFLGTAMAWGQAVDGPGGRSEIVDGVEVLTRGPVHEAFAETITFDPEPGVVVDKPAPEPIEELPPEQKPEGANVAWVPGYWAWDDERNDFLWVSGIWRALPPGRQWISGYWSRSGRGSQWTSGYWVDAKLSEIEYLPEPPATVEAGPNVRAPSPDHTWLPGCWVWQQTRYAWRPGFWAAVQPNWVWIPAHYVWAPRGYVFVDGYYDYVVARRGVVFAPVYFHSGIYTQRRFSYSPVIAINPVVFATHLFLRPSYGHYYYGDYYGTNYASIGFSPWFSFHSSRYGYDPFYAHQRWHHRNDREWDRRMAADFAHRRDHEEARPPRTWTAQRDRGTRNTTNIDTSVVIAASINELAKVTETPIRFQPVAREERQQIAQRGQEVRKAREQRQQLEEKATDPSADAPTPTEKPVKVQLPKSPISARPDEQLGKEDVPPTTIEPPRPDSNIEPKSRKGRGKTESDPESKAKKREPRPEQPKEDSKSPKSEPKPGRPKSDPNAPKAEPKADRPKAESKTPKEPKPDRPKADPNAPTDPKAPKAEPKPEPSKPEPKAPKAEPKPEPSKPEPKAPKAEPKPEPSKPEPKAPKAEPKPEPSKPEPKAPKAEPKPEPPKPDPNAPKAEPKPEPPKPQPKAPKAEPKPEPPKPDPNVPKAEPKPKPTKPKPKAPKAEPNPEQPKAEANELDA